MEELLNWITGLNKNTKVKITESPLTEEGFWFYDKKTYTIKNRSNSFFHITGIQGEINNEVISHPIIVQKEIGYLGIICKEINGELMFLMQAKIEPGNINCVQISPTLQATKSNFLQLHGGRKPNYLEYFINAQDYEILADQIQSEQSSRFYKKRNRNIIIKVEKEIEVLPNYKWMSLKQIKELMKQPNLVNMDTRTVISCLPLFWNILDNKVDTKSEIISIYNKINSYKMMNYVEPQLIGLNELDNWEINNDGIFSKNISPFDVIIYDIEIEGREVQKWQQPLFKSNGKAIFGLIRTNTEEGYKYLVRVIPEIGAFDGMEIGPTIQKECTDSNSNNYADEIFWKYLENNNNVIFDTILSEEGGRFYHEENRNIIIEVDEIEVDKLPHDYELVSYQTLVELIMVNNCLNIQLRNLLSTLEDY